MGGAILAILARAQGAARAATRAATARLDRLADFLLDNVFPGSGGLWSVRAFFVLIVIAAVALGIGGARMLIDDDQATAPNAPLAAGGQPAVVSTDPTPSPTATPEPTPSDNPTPAPTPTPSPTPGNVTIRGPIDASDMSGAGLRVGVHEALLGFDPKGGPVSGTFTIEIKEFPIGSLLTRTFDGEKDPDYAEFKKCTVTMALVGKVNGSYAADTGKLSGKATFRAQTDDVDDCLKTRPSNISIDPDKVAKPTTVNWRAKFNGTRATGSLDMEPVMDFSATIED